MNNLARRLALSIVVLSAFGTVTTLTDANQHEQSLNPPSVDQQILLDTLTLINNQREPVVAAAHALWSSTASCTIIRSDNQYNGQSSFLENCVFFNPMALQLCSAAPERSEYRFVDNVLIMVSFDIDDISAPKHYHDCIALYTQQLEFNNGVEVLIDDSFRTIVADAKKAQQLP